jgi:cytochrome b6-f complex iron-sulfur subunit
MTDDERARRLAELKRKMQESAKVKKGPPSADEAQVDVATVETTRLTVAPTVTVEPSPVKGGRKSTSGDRANSQMNRREFLTYAWGAAFGLAALQATAVSFFFMHPRFKAGEFGGTFYMGPETALPPTDAPPQGEPNGKFWWVNVEEEGPRAIYMVCTHLGCLYKWVDENHRFECPCHGSKFTREGFYIEGPAPRSLDQFAVDAVDGAYVVDTGARTLGPPSDESPFKGTG